MLTGDLTTYTSAACQGGKAVTLKAYAINPNVVNSFRATFNRSAVTKTQEPSFDGPDLGINMTTLVPNHVIITAGSLSNASVFSYAAFDPTSAYQLTDDLSIIKGKHQLTFGANWIRPVQYVHGPLLGDGSFTFTGQVTGLALSDFLVGDVATFSQQDIQYAYERYQYFGAYAQDNWRLIRT